MSAENDSVRQGRLTGQYLIDSVYTQLIGLCRGVLADGELNDAEIVALDQWLSTYAHHLPEWPGQVIARRIKRIVEDGIIDDVEREDLREYIERAAGVEGTQRFDLPTTLPLRRPPPHVEFHGRVFCLTGTFIFGPRREVIAAIEEQGGRVYDAVADWVDYLVIGSTVTPSWKYGTHGLKIESAIELVKAGGKLSIISEAHWGSSLC